MFSLRLETSLPRESPDQEDEFALETKDYALTTAKAKGDIFLEAKGEEEEEEGRKEVEGGRTEKDYEKDGEEVEGEEVGREVKKKR